MSKIWVYQIDVYDEQVPYPIVRHIFMGQTQQEAQSYYRMHLSNDSFLQGCLDGGEFNGHTFRCAAEWREAELRVSDGI